VRQGQPHQTGLRDLIGGLKTVLSSYSQGREKGRGGRGNRTASRDFKGKGGAGGWGGARKERVSQKVKLERHGRGTKGGE